MGSSTAVVAAVITAAVAVIVAVATQVWTSARSRSDRRYAARRTSIIEAQDALLDLRDVLGEYGPGSEPERRDEQAAGTSGNAGLLGPSGLDLQLERRKRTATGRLQATVARVHDAHIFEAMISWRSAAERRFVSVAETTAGVEDEWFTYVQQLCRLGLTSTDGSVPSKDRRRIAVPVNLVD